MQLWLIRHTLAVTEEEDPRRPLSREGREAAVEIGRFLARSGVLAGATLCWHSPLLRAAQTAEDLLEAARPGLARHEVSGLLPEDDPVEIADRLEKWRGGSLVLVGHEPHLGALGTLLARGKLKPVMFDFKKGSVLALESTGGEHRKTGRRRWEVRWLLSPELLRSPPAGK